MEKISTEARFSGIVEKTEKDLDGLKVEEIAIDQIDFPIREREYEDGITRDMEFVKLVGSIKQNGLIQPIVVMKKEDGRYLKIAGGRRIEAFKILKKEKIPAVVIQDIDEIDVFKLMLDENEVREDLNKVEKTEILLKALCVYFIKDEAFLKSEEEKLECGRNKFKEIYSAIRKGDKGELIVKWGEFAKKFNLNVETFKDDISLTLIKEPFKTLYKEGIINKNIARRVNAVGKKSIEAWNYLAYRVYLLNEIEDVEVKKRKINELIDYVLNYTNYIKKRLEKAFKERKKQGINFEKKLDELRNEIYQNNTEEKRIEFSKFKKLEGELKKIDFISVDDEGKYKELIEKLKNDLTEESIKNALNIIDEYYKNKQEVGQINVKLAEKTFNSFKKTERKFKKSIPLLNKNEIELIEDYLQKIELLLKGKK